VSLVVWASAARKFAGFRVSGSLGVSGKSYLAVCHAVIPSALAVMAVCIYETGELKSSLFRPVSHAVGCLAAPAVAQDTYAFALMLSEVRDFNGMPLPGNADSLPFDAPPLVCEAVVIRTTRQTARLRTAAVVLPFVATAHPA
jgi:hypothetical protein